LLLYSMTVTECIDRWPRRSTSVRNDKNTYEDSKQVTDMEFNSSRPLRVLIVEDDPTSSALLEGFLSKSLLVISRIESVKTFASAVNCLEKSCFDVVLLDLNLPDSRGLETLARMNEEHPRVAKVVITGDYSEDLGLKAVVQGAQEYLVKGGYDVSSLGKSIRYAVERKRAEVMLSEANEFREKVVESVTNGIYVVEPDGKFRFVNRAGLQITGYKADELIGRKFSVLFKAEVLAHLKEPLARAEETGSNVSHFETEILRKDKSAAFINLGVLPLFENDEPAGTVWTAEDITEQKRIHEILDRKQKNLEAIFDAAPVGMALVDEDAIVRRVNDDIRRMVRKDYAEIINQQIGNSLGCVYSERQGGCGSAPSCAECPLAAAVRCVLDSEQAVHKVEFKPRLRTGDEEVEPWLCISAEPVVIDGERYAVLAVDDITQRKGAEEQLRETMKIKSQFISTVSHELRTPLASMKEAVAIVLDGIVGQVNDKQKNFLDIAERNIDRLARLINDVLDFQKLDSERMKFNMRENDITVVAEDVYRTMAPFANKRFVNLSLDIEDRLPKAMFDSDRIIQVLTNLVSNAIKFTPEQGRVCLGIRRRDEELVLAVKDTGMGIPPDDLHKVFERFYRVDRPGKEIQGTGLGLPIVKKIVTSHGGRIEVESELEKGTTFTVYLPLAAKQSKESATDRQEEPVSRAAANN